MKAPTLNKKKFSIGQYSYVLIFAALFLGMLSKKKNLMTNEGIQGFQQVLNSLQFQRGAEEAGKQLPLLYQPPEIALGNGAGVTCEKTRKF